MDSIHTIETLNQIQIWSWYYQDQIWYPSCEMCHKTTLLTRTGSSPARVAPCSWPQWHQCAFYSVRRKTSGDAYAFYAFYAWWIYLPYKCTSTITARLVAGISFKLTKWRYKFWKRCRRCASTRDDLQWPSSPQPVVNSLCGYGNVQNRFTDIRSNMLIKNFTNQELTWPGNSSGTIEQSKGFSVVWRVQGIEWSDESVSMSTLPRVDSRSFRSGFLSLCAEWLIETWSKKCWFTEMAEW